MSFIVRQLQYVDSAQLFSLVADLPWAVFLDSGRFSEDGKPKHSDFDVLAICPRTTLITEGEISTVCNRVTDAEAVLHKHPLLNRYVWEPLFESNKDPLLVLQQQMGGIEQSFQKFSKDSVSQQYNLSYLPGAIGYFAYDLARRFERLPDLANDSEQLPAMACGIYDVVVVVDHQQKHTTLISWLSGEGGAEADWLTEYWQLLIQHTALAADSGGLAQATNVLVSQGISENMDKPAYQRSFEAVRDYTIAGDCYQVNLAKQFSTEVSGNPWATYLHLRAASPAPYGSYLNLPFAQVLSNSPESFIQCRQGQVVTSPIKGTQPRDHNDLDNDKAIANGLRNSPKDRAENLMIVDLMRNDLSRCCELGSVKVPKLFALHSFANVHHLISTITGVLKSDLHPIDLLRSCFPGGSITGAPKIRAMQIIEELEPDRRGLYCGSIGYLGADGGLETNIAIRTIVIKDGIARFSAGGGLVIDSKLDDEYQEIIDKARMMTEALTSINQ